MPTEKKRQLRTVDTKDSESSIPLEEQTTIRISRELREKLKAIALIKRCTLMSLTESALEEYCKQWEAASGQRLSKFMNPSKS